MKKLFKGQSVVVISLREKSVIEIRDEMVAASGEKITRFQNDYKTYGTKHLLTTLEELTQLNILGFIVAENETFINAFIKHAKTKRAEGLERAKAELDAKPLSKRFQRHYELYAKPITVNDLRKSAQHCVA